jgi:chromosome segregation ATPase
MSTGRGASGDASATGFYPKSPIGAVHSGPTQERKKGTASIAPLDWGEVADAAGNSGETPTPDFSKVGEGEELSSQPPVRVLDIVEADESVLPLLKRLLGHAWIVPGLAQAARLWSLNPGHCEFVTHTCEILTQNGVFIGGSRKEIPVSSSILGRKNEIADLKKAIVKAKRYSRSRPPRNCSISKSSGKTSSDSSEMFLRNAPPRFGNTAPENPSDHKQQAGPSRAGCL